MPEGSVNLGSAYAELTIKKDGFNSGLTEANNQLTAFQQQTQAKLDVLSTGFTGLGKSMSKFGGQLTATVTAPITGLATAAVKTTAQFDASMSQVYATMGDKANDMVEYNGEVVSSMEALRDFAQEMGAQTKFSASESAEALNYMALAGYNAETSMKMLPNVLNLAAAGNMGLAKASDMVTDTQTAFGISLERTSQMVDEMAKAASTGNTSVEQLGEAFLTVGGLAKELNGGLVTLADGTTQEVDNVQELEIALTAMANAGIKGSEAGTHMRNMLLKLASPTKEGAETFERLGVSVFDAEGKMKSLDDVFTDLNAALSNLTQQEKLEAISDIFNTRDTAAAEALLSAVGQDWDDIGEAILKADGAAGTMADTQLNNLNGQLTILKSAVEGLMIQIGDIVMPYLTQLVSKIQEIVQYFISLDEEQKKQILRWAAIAAAIGPVLMIFGKLLTSVGGLIKTFSSLSAFIVKFSQVFGLISSGAGGVTAALASIASAIAPVLAAAAAIGTVVYALKQLYDQGGEFQIYLDGFMEDISSTLTGVFESVKTVASSLFGYLQEVWGKITDIFTSSIDLDGLDSAFGDLVLELNVLFLKLKEVAAQIKDVFIVVLNVAKPVLTVIGTLASSVAGVIVGVVNGAIKAFEPLLYVVGDVVEVVYDVISVIQGLFKGIFTQDWSDLAKSFDTLITDVKLLFTDLFSSIGAFFTGFFQGFIGTIDAFTGGIATKLVNFFVNLWGDISKFFTVTIPEAFNNFINVTIPNFIESIKIWFDELPYNLGYAIGQAIVAVEQFGIDLYNWASEAIPQFIDNACLFFSQLPDRIYEFFFNLYTKIHDWWTNMREEASENSKKFYENMLKWFKELPGKVWEYIKSLPEKVRQVGESLKNAGKKIFTDLWDGMKAIWDSIAKWFEDIWGKVKSFVQGIKDGISDASSASSSVAGSHAGGLEYVPYNGYIAQLHEGERVLTKNEAKEYDTGSGVRQYSFYYYSPKAIDPYEADKKFRASVREVEGGFA